jgi:glycerol-3-phosphate dehydrogenase
LIERDLERVAGSSFDLVVVGGGVYGIALTLEAARRGMKPLLVERSDFGGETSWNTLRILHGGLRSLQTLDLRRFREMVEERRWWFQYFPELVEPLPCLMPLYGRGLRRPAVLRMALVASDFLSRQRNHEVRPDRELSKGSIVGPAEVLDICPRLERRGLLGGALWYDGLMPDSSRLLMEMLHWAVGCGALALNYVEATSLRVEGGAVIGVEVRDVQSDRIFEVQTPTVVNCAGPWCRDVASAFDRDVPELFHPSLAFNLVLDRSPLTTAALAVNPRISQGGRAYFLVPWKGRILAGTYHSHWGRSKDEGGVDDDLIQLFLDELNAAIPGLDLQPREVLRVLGGFLPARRGSSDRLVTREVIRHHSDLGGPQGLFSISGVKFTTARLVAERTLHKIRRWQNMELPEPGESLPPNKIRLVTWRELQEMLERDGDRAREYLEALVARESVVCLDDLMLRRTDWGLDPADSDSRKAVVISLLESLTWPSSICEFSS